MPGAAIKVLRDGIAVDTAEKPVRTVEGGAGDLFVGRKLLGYPRSAEGTDDVVPIKNTADFFVVCTVKSSPDIADA